MKTNDEIQHIAGEPSVLRRSVALVERMAGATLAHGNCLGQLSVEALKDLGAATRSELESVHGEATVIEAEEVKVERAVSEICDDGVVTPAEKRTLKRLFPAFARLVTFHRRHTGRLVA